MEVLEFPMVAEGATYVPSGAALSLAGFRAWYATDDFPEEGRICYLAGELFIDMGHERISSHVALKTALTQILSSLASEINLGQLFGDGVRLVSEDADLSSEPDGCYLTWAAVTDGRVKLQKSSDGMDVTEVIGAPDMVLEVVSPSSVRKDKVRLPDLYYRAGIPEYWLIDARKDAISFTIYRATPEGYVPVAERDSWLLSRAFGRDFRIECARSPIGTWQYSLLIRSGE